MARATALGLMFRIAWRNVRRNWRHSIAALGTMAVGFVTLALFQGYLDELMQSQIHLIYSRNMLGELMVRKTGGGTHDARINPEKYLLQKDEQALLEDWIGRHSLDVKTHVRTLVVHGMELQVSFSAGLTEHLRGETVAQTLERADKLCYQAKTLGRNRVERG